MTQLSIRELFHDNPMLGEASRARRRLMRGSESGRASTLLGAIVIALFYVALVFYFGREFYLTGEFLFLELLVVTGVLPATVYAAVAGEREKATWESLVLTRLTPAQIIVGKLTWRMAWLLFIMALMLGAILVTELSRSQTYDIVRPVAIAGAKVIIFTFGFLVCSFGLWVSAMSKRSVTAIGIIYLSLVGVLLMIPTLLAMFRWDALREVVLDLNPFTIIVRLSEWFQGWEHQQTGWLYVMFPAILYVAIGFLLLVLTAQKMAQVEEPKEKR